MWDALWDAGQPYQMTPLGLEALDMLRIEAGLIFAGNEFDDQVDPFEAGIAFVVDLKSKEEDFSGKAALMRRKEHPQRHLVGLELEGNEPPLMATVSTSAAARWGSSPAERAHPFSKRTSPSAGWPWNTPRLERKSRLENWTAPEAHPGNSRTFSLLRSRKKTCSELTGQVPAPFPSSHVNSHRKIRMASHLPGMRNGSCQHWPRLSCPNRHSFDVAKEGYTNLLLNHGPRTRVAVSPRDVKARRSFLSAGFYRPLSDRLNRCVAQHLGQAEILQTEAQFTSLSKWDAGKATISVNSSAVLSLSVRSGLFAVSAWISPKPR